MNYTDYALEDFIHDQYFIQWVRNPEPVHELFWHSWLEEHPEKSQLIEQAREIVLFLSFDVIQPSKSEQQQVKANIKRLIAEEKTHVSAGENHKSKSIIRELVTSKRTIDFWRPYYKVAVLVTGIIVWTVVLLLFKLYNGPTIYSTSYGETKNITLPDGSTVTMNANSSIRYMDNWQQTHVREIWLSGEAFFDVLKKPEWKQAKFIVHTQGLNVEVLGTKFNVNNRRGIVKVVLNSGKVKLNQGTSKQEDVVMRPRDLVEFNGQNKAFVKKIVEPEAYSSWMQHKLTFDETPVREIAQLLEDNYGVQVIIKDPKVGDRKFTGSVPNKQINLLLDILAESLNIKVTTNKQTITISNN